MKRSIFLEGESDQWRFEYDGRHNALLLVCKAGDPDKAVLKIQNISHRIIMNGIDLLTQLDQELFGAKNASSNSSC